MHSFLILISVVLYLLAGFLVVDVVSDRWKEDFPDDPSIPLESLMAIFLAWPILFPLMYL